MKRTPRVRPAFTLVELFTVSKRGFTLVELLVVVAIIVILIGILMPALGAIRRKARDIATASQLDSIGKACESYRIAMDAYPGFRSEMQMANRMTHTGFSSTENMLHCLMGRILPAGHAQAVGDTDIGSTGYRVDDEAIGSGPMTVAGQVYGAFYTPKTGQTDAIQGASEGGNDFTDLVDASYGMPVLYFRAVPNGAQPVANSNAALLGTGQYPGTFQIDPLLPYIGKSSDPAKLKNRSMPNTYDQTTNSLLAGATAANDLAWFMINQKLSNTTGAANISGNVPRGGIVLMATGRDGIYLNKAQGTPSATTVSSFDDIVVGAGTAP